MALGKELRVIIVGDASKLSRELSKAAGATENFGSRMKSVGKSMTIAGGLITGVSVVIGKKLVDSALAAEVSQAKLEKAFDNAGLSAGKYTKAITGAEDAGRQFGFTNTETRDSLAKLVQGGDTVAQSMNDLALAQDYARATGRDLATATGSIVKVHQGLLRPLKELGISLPQNTDNMKALVAAHKESKTAITANEKALAFQQDKLATGAQAIHLMTGKLKGQSAAFSETSAGGMAAFSAQLENLQESLGTLLLPFLDKAVAVLSRLTEAFSGLSPETKKLIVDIGLGVAAFGVLMVVLGPVIAGIGTLLPVFVALASPIGIVVAALVLLTAALVAAVVWPDKLQAALQKMGLSAKQSKEIVDDLRNAFTAIKAVVQTVWPVIQAIIVPALQVIKGLLMIVSGILRGDFSEAWKGVKIVVANEMKFMLAIITAMPRLVLTAALAIGKAILDGISRGLANLGQWVQAKLQELPKALAAVAAAVPGMAAAIGAAIVRGILSGMGGLFSSVKDKIIGGVQGAIDGAMGIFGNSPQEVIGVALVDGIVRGWNAKAGSLKDELVSKTNTAIDGMLEAVKNKQGAFATAFDGLVSNALSAFDKITSEFQTRTEKLIAKQDAARANAERQATLASAQTGLATAQAGGDPEAIKQAEQALADALFAISRARNEKIAADERAAYEAKRERQRVNLEAQLAALQRNYAQQEISTTQFHNNLIALFKKFEVPLGKATAKLGFALAKGLNDSFADVQKAARALASEVLRAFENIKVVIKVNLEGTAPEQRAAGGPVRRGSAYIVGEVGPELFVPNSSGTIHTADATARMASAGGGVNVYVYGDVTGDEIVDKVREGLLKINLYNPGSAIARS